MKLKFFKIQLAGLIISSMALAGESGYILNGEAHVVFKDGKKVGKTLDEIKNETKGARSISSVSSDGYGLYINYQKHEGNICYYTYERNVYTQNVSCVKSN